jgi:hypothetical protein
VAGVEHNWSCIISFNNISSLLDRGRRPHDCCLSRFLPLGEVGAPDVAVAAVQGLRRVWCCDFRDYRLWHVWFLIFANFEVRQCVLTEISSLTVCDFPWFGTIIITIISICNVRFGWSMDAGNIDKI